MLIIESIPIMQKEPVEEKNGGKRSPLVALSRSVMPVAAVWIVSMQLGLFSLIILQLSAISVLAFLSALLLRHCVNYIQQKRGNGGRVREGREGGNILGRRGAEKRGTRIALGERGTD